MHRSEGSNKRTKYNGSEARAVDKEESEEDPKNPISDLLINHHPNRKGLYYIATTNTTAADTTDTNNPWIINDISIL